jgi:hypothetical protein
LSVAALLTPAFVNASAVTTLIAIAAFCALRLALRGHDDFLEPDSARLLARLIGMRDLRHRSHGHHRQR